MNPDRMNEIMTATSHVAEAAERLAKSCREFTTKDASYITFEQFQNAGIPIHAAANDLGACFASLATLQAKFEAENEK